MKRSWFHLLAIVALGAMVLCSPAWPQGTPAGTVIQNSASATYSNSSGVAQPALTSNTVNVTVAQVAAVSLSPATSSQQQPAGAAATYAVTVTNKGNGSDTFSLAAASASSPAWTAAIYKDDGANGGVANDGVRQAGETNIATSTGSLAADASFRCFVVVQVPSGAAVSSTDTTTLTATSQFDSAKKGTATCTTTVAAPALVLSKSVDKANAKAGEAIVYTITYQNSGSTSVQSVVITDAVPSGTTYVTNSVTLSGSQKTDASDSDEVTVSAGTITIVVGNVAAGASGTISFRVTVN